MTKCFIRLKNELPYFSAIKFWRFFLPGQLNFYQSWTDIFCIQCLPMHRKTLNDGQTIGQTPRWSTDNGEVIPVPVCLCKQHNKPTCIVQVDLHKSSVQRLSMNKIYALWIEKYRKVSWKHCAHFKVSRIF